MNGYAVVDASAFVASVLPDEQASESLRSALRDVVFVVPAIWPAEVVNTLCVAERRGRIDAEGIRLVLDRLRQRVPELEAAALEPCFTDTLGLARKHKLTVYDAMYLEIAIRRRLPLATLDADLRKAAKKATVKLL